ncbi:type II toxin-antitoxin system prevent-host-death family antitoxin [Actinomycetes bacterium KLBMP 9797]
MATEVAVNVGIRELRDSLSKHLAEVRSGRVVTITDHGRPIARIVPVDRPTRLEQLRAEGRVQPARAHKRPAPDPVTSSGTVSDLIGEQRR